MKPKPVVVRRDAQSRSATDKASAEPLVERPRAQFPLSSIMVLTAVAGIVMAPAFYLLRGQHGQSNMRLIGMLMMLAGPLLLVAAASTLVSIAEWWRKR